MDRVLRVQLIGDGKSKLGVAQSTPSNSLGLDSRDQGRCFELTVIRCAIVVVPNVNHYGFQVTTVSFDDLESWKCYSDLCLTFA